MPTYQGQISEEGLIDLVEFIKNLDSNYRINQTLVTAQSDQAAPVTPQPVVPQQGPGSNTGMVKP